MEQKHQVHHEVSEPAWPAVAKGTRNANRRGTEVTEEELEKLIDGPESKSKSVSGSKSVLDFDPDFDPDLDGPRGKSELDSLCSLCLRGEPDVFVP